MGFWVVVDNCAIPVVGTQSGEHIAEQLCGVCELTSYILGLLLGIAVVLDPLIASHGRAVWSVHTACCEDPLPLHQEYVAQMAPRIPGATTGRAAVGSAGR